MHIVAILSGKGGVGKTTTCFGVALALQDLGFKPGVLDLDLEEPLDCREGRGNRAHPTGPALPRRAD